MGKLLRVRREMNKEENINFTITLKRELLLSVERRDHGKKKRHKEQKNSSVKWNG